MNFLTKTQWIITEKKHLSKSKVLVKLARNFSTEVELDWKRIFHQLALREKDGNTYIDNQVALPHLVYDQAVVKTAGLLSVIRLSSPLPWYPGSPPVTMIWGLLSSESHHLKILKKLSTLLSQPRLVKTLYRSSPEKFLAFIKEPLLLMSNMVRKNSKPFSRSHFLSHCHAHKIFQMPPGFNIHARPAAEIAKLAKSLPGDIFFVTTNQAVKAESITDLLSLGNSVKRTLTLAIRYPHPGKMQDSQSQFTFRQIEATLMRSALSEIGDHRHLKLENTPVKMNESYYRIVKQAKKYNNIYPIELLFTRYYSLPKHQAKRGVGGRLWLYKHALLPEITLPSPNQNTGKKQASLKHLDQVSEQMTFFNQAVSKAILEIERSLKRKHLLNDTLIAIMSSHIDILKDESLHQEMKSHLLSLSKTRKMKQVSHPSILINSAWNRIVKNKIQTSPHLSRSADWEDLGHRVSSMILQMLYSKDQSQLPAQPKLKKSDPIQELEKLYLKYQKPLILVCDKIYPSEVISLMEVIAKGKVAAIIIGQGSKNSHAAIMLSNVFIPVVFFPGKNRSYQDFLSQIAQSFNQVVVDLVGSQLLGLAEGDEIESVLSQFESSPVKPGSQIIPSSSKKVAGGPLFPTHPDLEFHLNLNSASEWKFYRKKKDQFPYNQIRGVGMIRTELFFLDMKKKPSLAQQVKIYREIAEAFHPLPVVIRTLDLAKDKPIAFLSHDQDDFPLFSETKKVSQFNPKEKKFLEEQIEAVYRVSRDFPQVKILFPMVTSLEDFLTYYQLLSNAVKTHSSEVSWFSLEVGVMIEAPSLIYQLQALNRFVDFYSIGGNDLEQFLTLEPRQHSSGLYSSQHLSLLLAIKEVLKTNQGNGKNKSKPITFCGNQAINPQFLSDFIDLGLRKFSVSVGGIETLARNPSLEKMPSALSKWIGMDCFF